MRGGWLWFVIFITALTTSLVWYSVIESYNLAPSSEPELVLNSELVNQSKIKYTPKHSQAKEIVPILMYHYIRDYTNEADPLGIQLSTSPALFSTQLRSLKRAGYHTASLADFAANRLPAKPIILTFDDGYISHYTDAMPALQQEKMTGTFFIVSGFVGRPGYMNKTELSELKKAGMELGGHTITHINLANADYQAAFTQIHQSLKDRSSVFAYPSGRYNQETLNILSGVGVRAAVTTELGLATDKSDLLLLPRIRVKPNTDILKTIAEETIRLKLAANPSQLPGH